MQSEIVDRFVAFVLSERELYDAHDNNRVGFSLAQVGRYLRFVELAKSRYLLVSKEVSDRFKKKMEDARQQPGTRELTREEIAELETDRHLHDQLHFEIESFFLFAKILLDKIAHFVGDYFGQAHGISFRSHDKLCKGIEQYSKEKNLQIPSGMSDAMIELRTLVADYRDKQIAHLQNPRATHGTHIDSSGATQIGTSALYPTEKDKHSSSPTIEHVCSVIEVYVSHLENIVKMNRPKSRYKLKPHG